MGLYFSCAKKAIEELGHWLNMSKLQISDKTNIIAEDPGGATRMAAAIQKKGLPIKAMAYAKTTAARHGMGAACVGGTSLTIAYARLRRFSTYLEGPRGAKSRLTSLT